MKEKETSSGVVNIFFPFLTIDKCTKLFCTGCSKTMLIGPLYIVFFFWGPCLSPSCMFFLSQITCKSSEAESGGQSGKGALSLKKALPTTPIDKSILFVCRAAADPGFENRGAQPKMSGLKKNRAPCIRHCRGRGYRTRLIIYILLFMSKMDIFIICFFYTVRQEGRIIYFAFTHHPQTLNHRIGFFNNKIHHGKPCKWVGAEEMAHMTYQKCKWTTYRPKTKRVS